MKKLKNVIATFACTGLMFAITPAYAYYDSGDTGVIADLTAEEGTPVNCDFHTYTGKEGKTKYTCTVKKGGNTFGSSASCGGNANTQNCLDEARKACAALCKDKGGRMIEDATPLDAVSAE